MYDSYYLLYSRLNIVFARLIFIVIFLCIICIIFMLISWYYSKHNVYSFINKYSKNENLTYTEEYVKSLLKKHFLTSREDLLVVDFYETCPMKFCQHRTNFVFIEYLVLEDLVQKINHINPSDTDSILYALYNASKYFFNRV